MLNLFRSRDKAVRILLGAVVVVMGFSMLTYLIPNYNSDGRSGNDLVVATIAGEAIRPIAGNNGQRSIDCNPHHHVVIQI